MNEDTVRIRQEACDALVAVLKEKGQEVQKFSDDGKGGSFFVMLDSVSFTVASLLMQIIKNHEDRRGVLADFQISCSQMLELLNNEEQKKPPTH